MRFTWDAAKARNNFRKHGVLFEEAASVFYDPWAVTAADPDHSHDEERWITFGIALSGRLLVVSHTDRGGTIRVISARRAAQAERHVYEAE